MFKRRLRSLVNGIADKFFSGADAEPVQNKPVQLLRPRFIWRAM